MAIPDGEVRRISDLGVFILTATTSVFAYFWMVIVLMLWTPDEITVIEGVLTFLMFPLLVALAWAQDNDWFREQRRSHTEVEPKGAEPAVSHTGRRGTTAGEARPVAAKIGTGGDMTELEDRHNIVDLLKAKHYERRKSSAGGKVRFPPAL
jgi:hypothetical protein